MSTDKNPNDPLGAFEFADQIRGLGEVGSTSALMVENLAREVNRLRTLTRETNVERMIDEAEHAFHQDANHKSLPGSPTRAGLKRALKAAFDFQRGRTAGFGEQIPSQETFTAFLRHYTQLLITHTSMNTLGVPVRIQTEHQFVFPDMMSPSSADAQTVVAWLQQLACLPNVIEETMEVKQEAITSTVYEDVPEGFKVQDGEGRILCTVALNGELHHPELDRLRKENAQMHKQIATALYQPRVRTWMEYTFTREVADNKIELAHRLIEECGETVQAGGITLSEWIQIGEYVWDRPKGAITQELGDLSLVSAAYAYCQGVNIHEAGERKLEAVWGMVEEIRAKRLKKPKWEPKSITGIVIPENISSAMVDAATEVYNRNQSIKLAMAAGLRAVQPGRVRT